MWVDIDSSSRQQVALLRGLPTSIRCDRGRAHPNTRTKVEEYDGISHNRSVRFCDTTIDPYELETANLTILGATTGDGTQRPSAHVDEVATSRSAPPI